MARVVFFFCDTNTNMDEMITAWQYCVPHPSTFFIFIAGLEHPKVGGPILTDAAWPKNAILDPDVGAQHLQNAFGNKKTLNIDYLLHTMGNAIRLYPRDYQKKIKDFSHAITTERKNASMVAKNIKAIYGDIGIEQLINNIRLYPKSPTQQTKIDKLYNNVATDLKEELIEIELNKELQLPIERIALVGFGQGAINAFATAKRLNTLGIPIDLIADQPVAHQNTLFQPQESYEQYRDLRECFLITRATVLLGSYPKLRNGVGHSFRQIMPFFSHPSVAYQFYLLPVEQHRMALEHILYHLIQYRYCANIMKAASVAVFGGLSFIPTAYLQKIDGIDTQHITPHPTHISLLRNNMLQRGISNKTEPSLDQIYALEVLTQIAMPQQSGLVHMIIEEQNKILISVINQAYNSCTYLINIPSPPISNAYRNDYLQKVYHATEQYLKKQLNKEVFINIIQKAGHTLEVAAKLNEDERFQFRKALRFLTNVFLHLTGLFIIFNTLNYATRGTYLFFNQTEETRIARQTSHDVIQTVLSQKQKSLF